MNVRSCLLAGALLAAVLTAQDPPAMKAREWFYTPPADPNAKPAAKPGADTRLTTKPKTKVEVAHNNPTANPPIANPPSKPPSKPTQPQSPDSTFTNVAYSPRPLGLRYGVSRRNQNGDFVEVDSDSVFHSGDKVRINVRSNDTAYLYIVMGGTSGVWDFLFPSRKINGGNNKITGNQDFTIPGTGQFNMEGPAGTERLFLVLSRQPEPDLEKLLSDMRSRTTPAAAPTAPAAPAVVMASNRKVDDALLNQIRGEMASRDLVFEKVDESTPGDQKETALYVVNTNRSPNARLVVDLSLKHE